MPPKDSTRQSKRTKAEGNEDVLFPLLSLVSSVSEPEKFASALTEVLKTWLGCDAVKIDLVQNNVLLPRTEPCTRGLWAEADRGRQAGREDGSAETCQGLSFTDCMGTQLLIGSGESSAFKPTEHGSFWTNNLPAFLRRNEPRSKRGRGFVFCDCNGDGSIILTPLRHQGFLFGLLRATDRRTNRFDRDSVDMIEQAAQTLARILADSRENTALLNKTAQSEFRVSEEGYRTLLDGAGVGLIEVDLSECKKYLDHLKELGIENVADHLGRKPGELSRCVSALVVKDANWATINLYGASTKEDLLAHFHSVFTADGYGMFKNLLAALWEGGKRFHADTGSRSLNGEMKQISLDWYVTHGDEKWSRIICSVADITERKRAVDRLNEQLLFFQTLIDTVPTPIFYKDTETRYLGCNRAFEVYSKARKEDLVGKTVFDLMGDTLEARVHCLADHELLRFPGKKLYESSIDHPDGQKTTHINRKATFVRPDGTSAGIVGVILDITEQKAAEDRLRKSQEELRNLSRHLQSVREEERKAISREVHDQLGQTLTVLQMELALLMKKVPPSQRNLLEGTKQLKKRLQEAIEIVRSISARTRPEMLDDLGLVAAMEWQVMEFQKLTGLECLLHVDQADTEIEADLSTALFRILQEALTNVWRHAHATQVRVVLRAEKGTLLLEVRDNGGGITERQVTDSMSTGLIGMRERVYPWSGLVSIEGRSNAGTTVRVTVPLQSQD